MFKRTIQIGLVFLMSLGSTYSLAQPIDPWLADGLNKDIERNRNAAAEENAARERRAWQIRENKVQAEIAELKRTPFYGAIVYDIKNNFYGWGGGYLTKDFAVRQAMKYCKSLDCRIITIFENTCAMISKPDAGVKSFNDLFVAFDNNPQQAIIKSVRVCETKYGHDKCSYWGRVNNKAYCTGYDQGIYTTKTTLD